MEEPILKAFVLCDEITDSPDGSSQKDLHGAGLSMIHAADTFPIKRTFWGYIELSDQKSAGRVHLSVTRADSDRSFAFRPITVHFPDPLQCSIIVVRVFQCVFPEPGVYFVELWYDGDWLIDQRIEVT